MYTGLYVFPFFAYHRKTVEKHGLSLGVAGDPGKLWILAREVAISARWCIITKKRGVSMRQKIQPYLEQVKENTWCIVTGYARIPLYKLNKQDVILIDSGIPEDGKGIVACLQKARLNVKAVLTSHKHPDHIGNHLLLRRTFGAKLYMSRYTAAACAEPMNQVESYLGIASYRNIAQMMVEEFVPDVVIDWRGDSLEAEGVRFGILHFPGHCAEHMGFVTADNVAYLADTVLSKKIVTKLRTSFCTCVELDLRSKEAASKLKYDRYILAHNEVCDSIEELAILNRDILQGKADLLASLAQDYVTLEELVRRLMIFTGNDMSSVHKIRGTHHNVHVLLDYLLDTGVFTCRARDGKLQYKKQ